jgi:hypothetical protein
MKERNKVKERGKQTTKTKGVKGNKELTAIFD